ncbi:MAG: DUF2953 domain-containing protein [Clostridia bacterium]|nr:DUF2953 domain-containing protein [Clostridia bacterium]
MKALLIIGIVLASLALIIGLILAIPVKVILTNDEEKGVKLLYRLLFWTFGENPDPNNIIVRSAKQITGLSQIDNVKALKRTVDNSGISATAGQIADILLMLAGRVFWILQYCTLEKLRLRAVSAGDDAAQTAIDYGATCAVVYPLLGYINSNMKVVQRGWDVEVACDFDGSEQEFELEATVSVRLLHVFRALIYIVKKNVEKEVYKGGVS